MIATTSSPQPSSQLHHHASSWDFSQSSRETAETETLLRRPRPPLFTQKNTGFRARECSQAWIHAFPISQKCLHDCSESSITHNNKNRKKIMGPEHFARWGWQKVHETVARATSSPQSSWQLHHHASSWEVWEIGNAWIQAWEHSRARNPAFFRVKSGGRGRRRRVLCFRSFAARSGNVFDKMRAGL